MNKYSSVSVDTHIVDDVLACFRVPLDLRREKREHLAQNDVKITSRLSMFGRCNLVARALVRAEVAESGRRPSGAAS